MSAIRAACRKLNTFDLEGCTIYSSCEPCPMCLGAIYWAHIGKVYYGADRKDAADADFGDDFIYEELDKPIPMRRIPFLAMMHTEAQSPFKLWKEKPDKTAY